MGKRDSAFHRWRRKYFRMGEVHAWKRRRLNDLKRQWLRWRLCHCSGPRPGEIVTGPTDLVVTLVLRDGMYYLPEFLRHYRAVGVRHFVFLDNGSTDGTVAYLREQGDVTLLACALPFRHYKLPFRQSLTRCLRGQGWGLMVDVDELWDFPFSEHIKLSDFLKHLNESGANTALASMLDMHRPEDDLLGERGDEPFRSEEFPYYSLAGYQQRDYEDEYGRGNQRLDPRVPQWVGGARAYLFGDVQNQTKHALFRVGSKARLVTSSSHDAERAVVADVTTVLKHYYLLPGYGEKVVRVAREGTHNQGSLHYKLILEQFKDRTTWPLELPRAKKLVETGQLVEAGFLHVSEEYRKSVATPETTQRPATS